MMQKPKAILHISDLHISVDSKVSYISVLEDTCNDGFEILFIDKVNKLMTEYDLYLIVSGDITDKAQKEEFEYAEKFIKKLNIPTEKVLIIPGNHDVNWDDNRLAYSKAIVDNNGKKDGLKEYYKFKEEKFEKFSSFYSLLKRGEKFNVNDVVIDKLVFKEEKLIIFSLNSCEKCSERDGGHGFIDIQKLDSELIEFDKKEEFQDYSKVAVCHQNPLKNYIKSDNEGFETGNWYRVKNTLVKHDINSIIFGHEHTPDSTEKDGFIYISAGSLAKKNLPALQFDLIKIVGNQEELKLDIRYYTHQNDNVEKYPDGFWLAATDSPYNKYVYLRKIPLGVSIDTNPILPSSLQQTPINDINTRAETKSTQVTSFGLGDNCIFEQEIFKRVKELEVFKSGHFHWSDDSRAHNWIDIPKLLDKTEDVFLIQKSILQSILKNNIEFDIIIGLGIEGNVIASRCALFYDKPYSFLPYSYRYDDHAEYEKELKIITKGIKKILIITDVVHDGKTIKKVFSDNHTYFENDEITNISVISLFYTGKNKEFAKDMFNVEGENRFNFYFVCNIPVEVCPYKEDPDWEKNCIIVSQKLGKVHEFYNKKRNDDLV